MMRAVHLLWNKVCSKTQPIDQLEHDTLAAVHLCAKLLVLKQVQIPHRQVDRKALVLLISLGILKGLEDVADCFDIGFIQSKGLDLEVQSCVLAQLWLEVFVGGFDEIEPVLPSLLVIVVDLAAIDVAEYTFERMRVIFFELDLGLFALL